MGSAPRYLILGGGPVVSELHLPAFAGLGWMDRVRVIDPAADAAHTIRRAYPQAEFRQADFREALDGARQDGFSAALIALPNALHEEAVDRALDLQFDVLCEKPLALTQPTCRRLATKAAALDRVLGVAMVRRFAPAVRAARKAIAAGWLGEIESVEIQWGSPFAWPSQSGAYFRRENGGVLANLGVHSLDMADYLFGAMEPVAYWDDWGGGAEANARFQLRTASGAAVVLSLSYTTELPNGITIRGTEGTLYFDHDAPAAQFTGRTSGIDATVSVSRPFDHGDWPPTLHSWFFEQIADFDRAVRTRDRAHATAEDAVRIASLIDWAYAHHVTRPRVELGLSSDVGRLRSTRAQPEVMSGRIVITGGTGFVGGHLIERLVSLGHDDILLPVRSYQSGANAGRFDVQMVRADLLQRSKLEAVLAGARYVFHLAYGRDGDDSARVTVEGTKNVVEAAIAVGAEAVVAVSTTALFGDPGGLVDEQAPAAPRSEYERLKGEAEQWTLARAATSPHTRVAVVNSACVYGPQGRMFTEMPARFLRAGVFCWIDDGRGLINYVYVTNLADALIRAAATDAAHGHRFIACDGATTWRDFFGRLLGPATDALPSFTRAELERMAAEQTPGLRALGTAVIRNPDLWRVIRSNPHFSKLKTMARSALPGLFDLVRTSRDAGRAANGHAPPSATPPPWMADLYGPMTTRFDVSKASRVLGWHPTVDLDAGIQASRDWLDRVGLMPDPARQ
jgi:predicted dehydrogenase/nucleoside-diphosphate-sugar epimerase